MKMLHHEELPEENLALENVRRNLKKKIDQYLMGVIVGAIMIGFSILFLVYHVAVTWRVETLPKSNNSLIGIFLSLGGSFLLTSSARKKKSAQLELAAIEQQLHK
ncbi:hypothetical protein [uncultured Fibrella sp.]|uniref:hypothetical protein n=1 Tax=uncultured Fibrella sp. TaxID=1284596 RepID=UPI0035CC00DD